MAPRHAKTIDANHTETIRELRKRGVYCLDLSSSGGGVTDIITVYRGKVVLIEIKFGNAVIKKTQAKFLSEYPGYSGIALSVEDAYKLATEPEKYALSAKQKDVLAGVWLRMSGKHSKLGPILRELSK